MPVLVTLATDAPLDLRYQDHALSGTWAGYRGYHVKPDPVLIYANLYDDTLQLARLGSHSELFGQGERRFPLSFSARLTHRIVMPIAPEHRWLYPIDWPELSNLIRFRRAKGRFEHCQRPHGRDVLHLGDGTWWDEGAATWRDGRGKRLRYVPAPARCPSSNPG